MFYNFIADSFHIKKPSEVRIYMENVRFAFLSPLWGA